MTHHAAEKSYAESTYWIVFVALLALLAATVAADQFQWGTWNTVVAFTISIAKASLVAIVFMKLGRAGAPLRLTAVAGLLWLSIAITLTMSDYLSRQ